MAFPPTSKTYTHMHTVHYIADCVWPTNIHFLQMGFWTPQQSIWTNYACAGKLMAPFQNDFLHFTSFVFLVHIVCVMIKLRWALFVTYTIIQSITSSKMCALHLTHPSAHRPGAVGGWRCGAQGAVGGSVPCSRVSPLSWTIPAGDGIRTHNLGLQVRHSIH